MKVVTRGIEHSLNTIWDIRCTCQFSTLLHIILNTCCILHHEKHPNRAHRLFLSPVMVKDLADLVINLIAITISDATLVLYTVYPSTICIHASLHEPGRTGYVHLTHLNCTMLGWFSFLRFRMSVSF